MATLIEGVPDPLGDGHPGVPQVSVSLLPRCQLPQDRELWAPHRGVGHSLLYHASSQGKIANDN